MARVCKYRFLQGQCTADLTKLTLGESTPGAICNIKGRVIGTFRVTLVKDGLLLRLAADLVESLMATLSKYAAFFKVTLTHWPTPSVAVIYGDRDQLETVKEALPETATPTIVTGQKKSQMEVYIQPDSAKAFIGLLGKETTYWDEPKWYTEQILEGQALISVKESEKYLPHPLNLDKSGAVSFTKGCYTGQEIVARTEYLGKPKKRARPVLLNCDLATAKQAILEQDLTHEQDGRKSIDAVSLTSYESNQTLANLILPIEQEASGQFYFSDTVITYEIIDLPYAITSDED